jgi:hypothetical protein
MSLLRARYVTVQLGLHGELPAVVESEDDRAVLLSLAVAVPPGLERMLDRPVRVESKSARGIQHVTGRAEWSRDRPEQLRIVKESQDTIQRREAVRVQAVVPARITVLNPPVPAGEGEPPCTLPAGPLKTVTLNLSITGLLLRDPAGLPMGTQVKLELELNPGEPPIAVTGTIVREHADEKGVHTLDISKVDQDRLSRFITEKQRAELRMSRG